MEGLAKTTSIIDNAMFFAILDRSCYPSAMGNPKRPRDTNQLAKHIVDLSTSNAEEEDPYYGKNPAAVELGRLGGLKGGKARAKKLTKEQRSAIAKKAAAARWKIKGSNSE